MSRTEKKEMKAAAIRNDTPSITEEQLLRMNLMEDMLFHKVVEDIDACEEMLQVILQRKDIHVLEVHPQHYLRNLQAHSVILDAYCELEDGTMVDIEIQKQKDTDFQKRMRFNRSNMDTNKIEKGIDYSEIPDAILIFISAFDYFGKGKTIYHIERRIAETGEVVYNGVTEIYLNTTVDDKTEISDLMRYFRNTEMSNKQFPRIANRVDYFKVKKEGADNMSPIADEIREKGRREGWEQGRLEEKLVSIHAVMKNLHLPFEEAARVVDVSEEEMETYRAMMQA